MATEKKFDAITILGVVLALAILIGGQMYLREKQARYDAYRRQQADIQAAVEAQVEKAKKSGPEAAPSLTAEAKPEVKPQKEGEKEQEPVAPKEPQVSPEAEPQPVPDVTVTTENLSLVFTARGATLQSASLASEYVDPFLKKQKGLEILTEIQQGQRAFGLPFLDIGLADSEISKERAVYDDKSKGALKSLDRRVWQLDYDSRAFDANGDWKLVYVIKLNDLYTLTKTFVVRRASNLVLCSVGVKNNSGTPVDYMYALNGPAGVLWDGGAFIDIRGELAGHEATLPDGALPAMDIKSVGPDVAAKEQDDTSAISDAENLWGAVKNHFYMSILISRNPEQLIKLKAVPIKADDTLAADKRYVKANLGIQGIRRRSAALAPGKNADDQYALYLGPAKEKQLDEAESELRLGQPLHLSEAIHYFTLGGNWTWPRMDWLARQLLWLFRGLYYVFGSYGVAVILLTLMIKAALHPLTRKMMVSMSKMAKLQPELKKVQERYKGQTSNEARQKMFLEQQKLMKSAGANPAAGCLPMFLQIPVFTALYGVFNRAFEIRGAQFWWIKDLSQPDHLMFLPFWPHVLNLLPLIYMGMTILQSQLSPTPKSNDPQQEMNRKMMMFMPLVISLMFYSMPAGLVLYFAASAVFGILESWYIKKHVLKDSPGPGAVVVPEKDGSGGKRPAGARA